jgi:hypothetical protein
VTGDFKELQTTIETHALEMLLGNKGLTSIVTEVVRAAALWGRDNRFAAKQQETK